MSLLIHKETTARALDQYVQEHGLRPYAARIDKLAPDDASPTWIFAGSGELRGLLQILLGFEPAFEWVTYEKEVAAAYGVPEGTCGWEVTNMDYQRWSGFEFSADAKGLEAAATRADLEDVFWGDFEEQLHYCDDVNFWGPTQKEELRGFIDAMLDDECAAKHLQVSRSERPQVVVYPMAPSEGQPVTLWRIVTDSKREMELLAEVTKEKAIEYCKDNELEFRIGEVCSREQQPAPRRAEDQGKILNEINMLPSLKLERVTRGEERTPIIIRKRHQSTL